MMAAEQYKMLTKHGHPNAGADGRIYAHVFVMSEMLGRALTDLEVVHHKDGDRGNNSPDNLQLFASQSEHATHHAEERALIECGNRLFRKCSYCKVYDDPQGMSTRKVGAGVYHKECANAASTKRRSTPEGKAKVKAFNDAR